MTKKDINYDQLKSQLESVWDKTLVALNKGKEEIIRLSKMGKLKLEAQMMVKDKNTVFQKMGEEVYEGLKSKSLDTEGLVKYVEKVDRIDDKIKACALKIEGLSKPKAAKKRSKKQ